MEFSRREEEGAKSLKEMGGRATQPKWCRRLSGPHHVRRRCALKRGKAMELVAAFESVACCVE